MYVISRRSPKAVHTFILQRSIKAEAMVKCKIILNDEEQVNE